MHGLLEIESIKVEENYFIIKPVISVFISSSFTESFRETFFNPPCTYPPLQSEYLNVKIIHVSVLSRVLFRYKIDAAGQIKAQGREGVFLRV